MVTVMKKPEIELFDPKTQGRKGHIVSAGAPKPVGPYPHARVHGGLVFVSGIGPRRQGSDDIPGVTWNADGEPEHNVTLQTESVMESLIAILKDAGSRLEYVLDVQVFLTNMKRDFADFNKVYAKYFEKVGAARTTVEVSSLPTPICVELKVIASLTEPG